MCAELQKQLALAVGMSEAWISRLCDGHPAVDRYAALVEGLARSGATEAGPLTMAPFALMARVMAERFGDEDLLPALDFALQLETDREGAENTEQVRRMLARGLPIEEELELEDRLGKALLRSMAAEAVVLGLIWERRRRVTLGRAH